MHCPRMAHNYRELQFQGIRHPLWPPEGTRNIGIQTYTQAKHSNTQTHKHLFNSVLGIQPALAILSPLTLPSEFPDDESIPAPVARTCCSQHAPVLLGYHTLPPQRLHTTIPSWVGGCPSSLPPTPEELCSAVFFVAPEQRAQVYLAGEPSFWSTKAAAGLCTSVEIAAIVLHGLELLAHGAEDSKVLFLSRCIHHRGVSAHLQDSQRHQGA